MNEPLYQHEIDCAYEQNVSAFELGDAPVYEIRTGTDAVVTLSDIVDHFHSASRATWTAHFVAIVDAENDLVAIVPRPLAATIVKVLNAIKGSNPP